MLLLVDNYDSFTFNLRDYFLQCNVEVEVIRNDKIEIDTILNKYSGIIISPGPGTPKDAGQTLKIIDQFHNKLPIFGVCLGLQAIGQYFGAKLTKASFPMHGKVSTLQFHSNHKMFENVVHPLEVCRYHSLMITDLENSDLEILASTKEGEIMAIAHKKLPIWAVQFHPEAILTTQGLKIINNWLTCFPLQHTKLNAI